MKITPQVICDILKKCMSLSNDQIWIYNQRRSIPEDKKLYIVVGLISSKFYGSNCIYDYSGTAVKEELGQHVCELISIDLLSYTNEAQERYSEALGSLASTYSERLQAENAFKIARIPISVNDASDVEGATLLNRISISLQVLRKYSNIINTDYFDEIPDCVIGMTGN